MLKLISIYLLFAAVLHSSSGSSCDSKCADNAEVDVFSLYTSIAKQDALEGMPLNEAPRTRGSVIDLDQPSFHFTGSHFLNDTGSKALKSLICGMCLRHSVTFHSSLFFAKNETGGSLMVLRNRDTMTTVFNIEVSSTGNTITVQYLHQHRLVTETFNIALRLGVWYKVALQFDGNKVNFFVNCRLVESRLISIPEYCYSGKSFSLVVGLEDKYYRGSLQSIRALSTSSINPMIKQCPDIDTDTVDCPICGSYLTSLKQLQSKQETIAELEEKLTNAVADLASYEELKAKEGNKCQIDSVNYDHGAFAKTRENEICFCQYGETHCVNPDELTIAPTPTEAVLTAMIPSPTTLPLETTPPDPNDNCGSKMVGNTNINLAVNEKDFTLNGDKCIINTCVLRVFGPDYQQDVENCDSVNSSCAELTDDVDKQLAVCCKHCDPCSFANCPNNSKCFPIGRDFQCQCNEGFQKSGDLCLDDDECLSGNHDCPADSVCFNIPGSFGCDCLKYSKFVSINGINACVDIDECAEKTHNCTEVDNSVCVNIDNGFRCDCRENFAQQEDGSCKPVCNPECQFGNCTGPNQCTCDVGYKGKYCDEDVNECDSSSDNLCGFLSDYIKYNISRCVNTFGGYFCSCIPGLQRIHKPDGSEVCRSIDECSLGVDNCPTGSICRDIPRGFVCECIHGDCQRKCLIEIEGREETLRNGDTRELGCVTCTCNNGEYSCAKKPCDCSDSEVNTDCCPECSRTNYCFGPEGLKLKVGDFLVNNNCTKIMCENNNGTPTLKSSIVQCPRLDCQKQYTPRGACCPVCSLPPCSSTTESKIVEIKKEVGNGCETCSCNGTVWSCHNTTCSAVCPSLGDCPAKYVTYLSSSDDCPVCVSPYSKQICSI